MSEIQESYALLMQIDKLLADIELKISRIEGKQERLRSTLSLLKDLERIALRYLAVVRRMGLPEDTEQLLQVGTKILIVFRQIQIAGTMLWASPTGAVLGVAGLALAQLTLLEGY